MSDVFSRAAHWTGQQCGRASVFMVAVIIIAWAVTGPFFHYSDTWQLIINTGTTIVTFLMVFLLQNTQNRDTAAIQLKLDELIRANRDARNIMCGLEDLSEEELLGAYLKATDDEPFWHLLPSGQWPSCSTVSIAASARRRSSAWKLPRPTWPWRFAI